MPDPWHEDVLDCLCVMDIELFDGVYMYAFNLSKPACLLVMSLGLFACGGDKSAQSGAGGASSAEPTSSTEAQTEVTPTADDAKTIKVVTTSDFPPFAFVDEKGALAGFDIDVINALAKNRGLNIEYLSASFDDLFTQVEAGTADVASSAIFYKEERAAKYGLTKPYHMDKPVYFYRADNTKLADANPKTISDLNNHELKIALVGQVEGLSDKHAIDSVSSEFVGFTGVLQGKYDVAFSDASVLNYSIKNNLTGESPLKSVAYQGELGYVLVTQKDNTKLLEELNAGIDELISSGEIKQLEEKYGINE